MLTKHVSRRKQAQNTALQHIANTPCVRPDSHRLPLAHLTTSHFTLAGFDSIGQGLTRPHNSRAKGPLMLRTVCSTRHFSSLTAASAQHTMTQHYCPHNSGKNSPCPNHTTISHLALNILTHKPLHVQCHGDCGCHGNSRQKSNTNRTIKHASDTENRVDRPSCAITHLRTGTTHPATTTHHPKWPHRQNWMPGDHTRPFSPVQTHHLLPRPAQCPLPTHPPAHVDCPVPTAQTAAARVTT